jgi:hypothetical protein
VTLTGRTPLADSPAVSGSPSARFGALDGLAGGALAEVVERGDDDRPAGVGIDGDLQVAGVAAGRGRRDRPAPSGSTWTNGSASYRCRSAVRSSSSEAVVRAVQVARMPRGIGARVGV